MKKSSFAFLLVLLLLGGYFFYDASIWKNFISGFFSKDLKSLREMSLSFMEDIKFKDFESAAKYHSPLNQKKINIPRLIERLFKVKPEFLDIMDYQIIEASLDSKGKRARVKVQSKIHLLNTDKIKNPEVIFYFHNKHGTWYMELESSLR